MGWLGGWKTSEELTRHLLAGYEEGSLSVKAVKHKKVREDDYTVLWALVQVVKAGQREIQIECYLLDKIDGSWAYKGMSEADGPGYYSCPIQFLSAAPCPPSEWAREWREKVYKFHGKAVPVAALTAERKPMQASLF